MVEGVLLEAPGDEESSKPDSWASLILPQVGGCRAAILWMKGNDCKYRVDLRQVRRLTPWLLSRLEQIHEFRWEVQIRWNN